MFWGRYNTENDPPLPPGLADGNWLDSNDNRGIRWTIDGLGAFNALAFFVIDPADVGGKFSIKVGKTLFSDLADGMRLKNGNIYFLRILLPEAVDRLNVRLSHDIHDDGFGVDGAIVGQIAPVPLPPAAALLLPALGAPRRPPPARARGAPDAPRAGAAEAPGPPGTSHEAFICVPHGLCMGFSAVFQRLDPGFPPGAR